MNSYRTKRIVAVGLASIVAAGSTAWAQNRNNLPDREAGAVRSDPPAAALPSTTSSVSSSVAAVHSRNLQRAADDYEEHSLEAFKEWDIKGADGETLGKLHDVLLDPKSGTFTRVIVSSGGIVGIGEKFRAVSVDQLQAGEEHFTAKLDRNAFEALPVVDEKELDARGGLRASRLEDRVLRSGDHKVGEVEGVVLDFQGRQAFAVVEVEAEFAGTEGEFLVPFDRLQFTQPVTEEIATTVRRADFAHVQPEYVQSLGSPAQNPTSGKSNASPGRADPGSDSPRHEGRTFGAAHDDSNAGGAAPNATPTDRDAPNNNERPNLSTAVSADRPGTKDAEQGSSDAWYADTGGNARGSVVPKNDDEDDRVPPAPEGEKRDGELTPTGR